MSGIAGIKTIVIGNDREFFSPIDKFVPPHLLVEFKQADLDEADMDIMWGGDNKLVFMPQNLDREYIRDICELFGYKNFHLVIPVAGSGLCTDIVRDHNALSVLVETIRLNPGVSIIPFGNSPEFYALLDELAQLELQFTTPETPDVEHRWIVGYYDTKVGCRELLQLTAARSNTIQIPRGRVVNTWVDAEKVVRILTSLGLGVVFKANEGGSGIGVNVYPPHSLETTEHVLEMLNSVMHNPLYTGEVPFIVEEYIPPDFSHHGVFPSVDVLITTDGNIRIQAVDAMVIKHDENEVSFYGCVAGVGLFSPDQSQLLRDMTVVIAQVLRELGYVGWFDVDYILSLNGVIVPTEVNLRRTSMCYMVEIGQRLFGPDFLSACAMRSNDKYIRPNLYGYTYASLRNLLSSILYPINAGRRGLIITEGIRSQYGRGKFGYLIIGSDQEDTWRIEQEMEGLLTGV